MEPPDQPFSQRIALLWFLALQARALADGELPPDAAKLRRKRDQISRLRRELAEEAAARGTEAREWNLLAAQIEALALLPSGEPTIPERRDRLHQAITARAGFTARFSPN